MVNEEPMVDAEQRMVNEEPMVDAEQRVFRRITGRFVDDELERRFRSHFFSVRSRWFRRFCLLVMLGGLVLSAFYVHNVVRGLNEGDKDIDIMQNILNNILEHVDELKMKQDQTDEKINTILQNAQNENDQKQAIEAL